MRHNRVRAAVLELMGRAGVRVFEDIKPPPGYMGAYIHIIDPSLCADIFWGGEVGFMDGFVRNKWTTNSLDDLFSCLLSVDADELTSCTLALWLPFLRHRLWPTLVAWNPFYDPQSRSRSRQAVTMHYDVGSGPFSDRLYGHQLGRQNVYSCAYWSGVDNLDDAQFQKLELLCRKLKLKRRTSEAEPRMRVLDVGCGRGDTAAHMARHYHAHVVGITLSEAQLAEALIRHKDLIDAGLIEFRLMDYRDLPPGEKYDRIVSVGMFEHVGLRNYKEFMRIMYLHLAPGGLLVLHTIASKRSTVIGDPWYEKVFRRGKVPSNAQLAIASERYFRELHSEDIGPHYDRTLMAWWRNFVDGWEKGGLRAAYAQLEEEKTPDEFYRFWSLYLLSAAATFRSGYNRVLQKVYTHHDWRGHYDFDRTNLLVPGR